MKKNTTMHNLLLLIAITNFAKIVPSLELEPSNDESTEHVTTKILVFDSDSDNETTNSNSTNASTLSTTQPYLHVHVPATFHTTDNPLALPSQTAQPNNHSATGESTIWWKILFPCCVNDNGIAPK